MLATVAALQLLFLAQVSAPAEPPPGEAPPPAAPEEGATAAPAPAPEETAPDAARPRPLQQSLLSAESLRGGSAALAWAGWPEIGVAYAIGFTNRDDLGVSFAHDWPKSETRIGVLYRRALSKAGRFDVAARMAAAWYVNSGADFVYEENHSDRGLEFVPGVSVSRRGAGGIVSALAEGPMTVTWKHKNGFLFSPRASLAFETPLYHSVTVGARVGLGYRAGAGDAPLKDGRGEVQFLVVAGYQLL